MIELKARQEKGEMIDAFEVNKKSNANLIQLNMQLNVNFLYDCQKFN